MPTFLNKILNVFSTNSANELVDSGVDFAEISYSDLLANFSILGNVSENRFAFIASSTTTNQPMSNGQFSVFLTDGVLPLSGAKIFKIFTAKEEAQSAQVAATLHEQLEPFIEIVSNNGKTRPFFGSTSTVRDFSTIALLHPDWSSAHLMAAMAKISFVDAKNLYPKEAIHCKINAQSQKTGLTPLMVAFETRNQAFIQEALATNGLLRAMIDFTLTDKMNRNYVYYAVAYHIQSYSTTDPDREKDAVLANVVMNCPESARVVDSEGRSALHLAVAAKRLDILRFLVNRSIGALEHSPKSVAPLLHIAAEAGHLEIVQFLLEHAVELLLLKDSKYNATPLHWATTLEVVDALLDAGCDTDAISLSGETAIHVALRYERIPVVSALVAFAAKLDVVAPNYGAPLHMVASGQKPSKPGEARQIVEMLIAYNCDVNVKDGKGNTARHLAAIGAQPPPEPDPNATAALRIQNALSAFLNFNDDEKRRREECEIILGLLHNVGAKRCEPGKIGCAPGCAFDGSFDGRMPPDFAIFPLIDPCVAECPAAVMIDKLLSDNAVAAYQRNPAAYQDRMRMLCLDGGGIRGIMSCLVLRNLEREIGLPIVECFDFIAGTSVGGLIALFLIYGKPYGPPFAPCSDDRLANMQRLAYHMRRKVFIGSRPYASNGFESLLKKAFGEETQFSSVTHPMAMVTSVLANRFPADLVLFRNYSSAVELYDQAHPEIREQAAALAAFQAAQAETAKKTISPSNSTAKLDSNNNNGNNGNNNNNNNRATSPLVPARSTSPPPGISVTCGSASVIPYGSPPNGASSPISPSSSSMLDDRTFVWKAARSTGAAPTYFRASGNYIDGGVMANNPTADAMTDVCQLASAAKALGFGEDYAAERYRIGIVVSVGTGREVQHQTPVADLRRPEGIIDFAGLYKSVLAFINLLVDQATVTDGRPVDRSRAWCSQMDAMFYRLSPLFSHHVELDEHDDIVLIRALYETRAYMHNNADQVKQLATILREQALARNPLLLNNNNNSSTSGGETSRMSIED